MLTMPLQRPCFSTASIYENVRPYQNSIRVSKSWTMLSSNSSPARKEKELISRELRSRLFVPETDKIGLQQRDQTVLTRGDESEFEHFVARDARFDEEYWSAAWLRAESHFEDREDDRYVDNYVRRFAQQEFNEMKRRYNSQLGDICKCIVAVNKDHKNAKSTVLEKVFGTLDLSIGYLSHGENFPGDRVKTPLFYFTERKPSVRYGYIYNLCVAKSARRRGIARRLLRYAVLSAKANGAEKVFVHVRRDNKPAQSLYQEMGFRVVEAASSRFSDDQIHLLCLNFQTNYDNFN